MANSASLAIMATADFKKAQAEIDKTATGMDKFKSASSTAGKVAAGALVAVGAAAISAGKAAAEDAQSQVLLATAMKNATGASKSQIASMEDWISKTAMATGVADDELRPALGALVRATGDVSKSQQAMALALDIAAATGKDVGAVSDALAKGYAGQTTAIGRLVPGIDKAILASGDMKKITAELARTTGGSAAAAADTAAGKFQIMQVAMDEAKESAGAALLPVMEDLATAMADAAGWAQKNSKTVQVLAVVIAGLSVAVIAVNAAMKLAAATSAVFSVAQGIMAAATGAGATALAGNTAALAAYNVASKLAAAGTWLMNTALLASPLTWIVIGVVALVAAFVLLIKNSESTRKAIAALWSGIKSGAKAAWNAVTAAFNGILAGVKAAFNWIKGNWPLLLAIITGPIGLAVLAITKNWDKIKTGASNVVKWIKDKFSGLTAVLAAPFDGMKKALDAVIGAVESLIKWLGKIKIPKISLPNIPGLGKAAAPAATVVGPQSRATTTAAAGPAININVTGALDPEAVARQIQRILAGHNRRVGLAT